VLNNYLLTLPYPLRWVVFLSVCGLGAVAAGIVFGLFVVAFKATALAFGVDIN
jgi:hypothetical protein